VINVCDFLCEKYTLFVLSGIKIAIRYSFVTICISLSFLLTSCVSSSIYDDKHFNPPVFFGSHVVRSGDTLYAIAQRYGRDFKELAKANNVSAPYTLLLGQKIALELSVSARQALKSSAITSRSSSANVTKGKERNGIRKKITKNKKHKQFKDIKWSWPHLGPILAKYKTEKSASASVGVNKGINIGGRLGDSIIAAAAGEVVYAGNGLLGYGNLVIINHDKRYLSAYAHNSLILVQEGQKITKGQRIAEMGRSGVDKTMLHFEIRRDGDPVDPLKFLPRR